MSTSRGRRAREASMDGNDVATTTEMVDQLLTEIGRKRPRVRVPGFGTLILRGRIWFIRYSHRGVGPVASAVKCAGLMLTTVNMKPPTHVATQALIMNFATGV